LDESGAIPPTPQWLREARQRGVLSRLSDPLAAALVQGGQRVSYPAGAQVAGWEESPWAAVVLRGCMRVFLPSPEGGQITLRYLRIGDIIGTFDGTQPVLARSLQAIESAELLHLDVSRLSTLAQSEPQLAWVLLLETVQALRQAHRSYSIRTFGSIRLRVANALLERALVCGGAVAGTVVLGTQHELATAAGTVREVIASALQALKREGVIEVRRGRVVILDPVRLAREADGGLGVGPPD
jgi:CRP-like cAMP-binding protein